MVIVTWMPSWGSSTTCSVDHSPVITPSGGQRSVVVVVSSSVRPVGCGGVPTVVSYVVREVDVWSSMDVWLSAVVVTGPLLESWVLEAWSRAMTRVLGVEVAAAGR